MKSSAGIEFYFGKSTFAALGFILSLLFMVYACLFRAAGLEGPFQLILWLNRSKMLDGLLFLLVYICSVILTYDIFRTLHIKTSTEEFRQNAAQKALLDLALIIISICFGTFIFSFHAFDMLGNIPVGRD